MSDPNSVKYHYSASFTLSMTRPMLALVSSKLVLGIGDTLFIMPGRFGNETAAAIPRLFSCTATK